MTPMENGSMDARIARVEQRLKDMGEDMRAMAPLAATSAAQAVTLAGIEDDIRELRRDAKDLGEVMRGQINKLQAAVDQRGRDESAAARSRRNAIIAAAAVIVAAAVSSIGSFIALLAQQGAHP